MRRARAILLAALLAAPACLAAPPAHGRSAPVLLAVQLRDTIGKRTPKPLRPFYNTRSNQPLWLDPLGRPSPAVAMLQTLLDSAPLDGLNPKKLRAGDLGKAISKARDEPDVDNLARLEVAASRAYAAYVEALRKAPRAQMIYTSPALAPAIPTPSASLNAAAMAPSLTNWIRSIGWMSPLYAPLRRALATPAFSPAQRTQLAQNLARVRALPAINTGRWVLVDTASARLWMYDGARPVDSMKVVVGKPSTQTPLIAGFLRYALVNPYWNIPDDMMPSRITDKVLESGPGFVKTHGFEVLDGWNEGARVLDPAEVDWQAVKAGTLPLRARQLPGRDNFMGRVKFMFPNERGIYLHDTPERDLLAKPQRQFSNGCVRLEDAARLGRWLLEKPLPTNVRTPEQRIELPVPVPIYITYLTAQPTGQTVAFRSDVYGLDAAARAVGSGLAQAR